MGLPADILRRPAPAAERHGRPPEPTPRLHWVPIRSLAERHRARILAHLLALPEPDRYLRFGYAASDAQIARYTDLIDFAHDEVLGIFNRRLELIALAHLAALPGGKEAEFGVSVLPGARGRGYGSRLFDHAVLHARNRDIDTLVIHALSENTAMLRIARQAGAQIMRDGGEAQARLRLPPDTLQSHLDQLVEEGAAEIDYRFKVQAKRVAGVIESLGEIKEQLTGVGGTNRE
jgi:ribosomal protein S18 acetylase RimI-like enzyme